MLVRPSSNMPGLARGALGGPISWFGGPGDPTSGNRTASGAPISQPGIAVYNRSTLGGWWMVKMPNGVIGLVQQTDLGPAPSTGRTFDFSYSILNQLGYTQQSFPTNASAQGLYIGKAANAQQLVGNYGTQISSALGALGPTPQQNAAFIGQLDAGAAGLRGGTFAVDPSGHAASSNASTAIGSEAVPSNIIPSPSVPGLDVAGALVNIWDSLTTPALWRRVLYFIGGGVLLFWGLKELTGAQIPAMKLAKAVAK